MALNEVEITRSASGQPGVQLLGGTRAQAERSGVVDVQISMSHSGGVAVANALAVWRSLEDC
jgi:holo-[acyl-carrier protein] synthase